MGEPLKVLVVDDDPRMVRTIRDILKAKGYAVLSAYTGEDGVEMVKEEKPDCVLMDIKMPGMNGVEALKMIQAIDPGLPVVLMSAYASEEQVEEAGSQGAYSVLTKPIDIRQLLFFLSLLGKEESILVVDDDPQFRSLMSDVFRSKNYDVVAEGDPEKALALLEQKYALVVVLDLNLGGVNGVDVMEEIRRRYPSKPVVLVTGCGEEMAASIEKGLHIGAITCLYKPFRPQELVRIVEEVNRSSLKKLITQPFS